MDNRCKELCITECSHCLERWQNMKKCDRCKKNLPNRNEYVECLKNQYRKKEQIICNDCCNMWINFLTDEWKKFIR